MNDFDVVMYGLPDTRFDVGAIEQRLKALGFKMLNLNLPLFDSRHIATFAQWRAATAIAHSEMGHVGFCKGGMLKGFSEDTLNCHAANAHFGLQIAMELGIFNLSKEYQEKYLNIAVYHSRLAIEHGPSWSFPEAEAPLYFMLCWFEPVFHAAMAQSYATMRVPDKILLREWFEKVIQRGKLDKTAPGRISDSDRGYLLKLSLCALLADDLQSAHKFFRLLKTDRRFPHQYAQIKAILDHPKSGS